MSAAAVIALIDAHGDIAIAYDPDWLALWSKRFADPLSDAETFGLDGNRVSDIGRRPTKLDEVSGQYMGLLKFTPAGWRAVEASLADLAHEDRDRLDMTGLLARLIESGVFVEGVPVVGPWGEVDDGNDLAVCEDLIAKGRWPVPS